MDEGNGQEAYEGPLPGGRDETTGAEPTPAAPTPADPTPADPTPAVGPSASSPMPLSMPPFSPLADASASAEVPAPFDLERDPTLEEVGAVPPGPEAPGTALPGAAGGAPPLGGQPPYLPPYGYGWPPGGLPAAEASGPSARSPRRRRALTALAVVALLTGGLGAGLGVAFAGTGPGGSGAGSASSSPGSSLSSTGPRMSVSAIASSVEPAVVDIRTTVVSPVGQELSRAAGTGMIITASGEVLTNNHVVENATSIHVGIAQHPGSFTAKVLGVNPTKDVALLQIEGISNLPYVSFGSSSSVAVGDSVVAVGNALGLGGTPSVVTGQISALGRTITASDPGLQSETLHNLLQTTAPIQPGDSGGPLLDAQGKVIGMDTAAASGDSGSSVGFAIPINEARTIVTQMQHHEAVGGTILGASPFLGVYETSAGSGRTGTSPFFGGLPGFGGTGSSGTPSSSARGVTVAAVAVSSPAERSGIRGGDVITSIDGTPTPTWSALKAAVQARKPGQTITVTYVGTSGTSRTVHVPLAGLPR